jgi:hypothetical protein
MKLMKLDSNMMRTVNYYGTDIQIPSDHVAVASDSNGEVYSYDDIPSLSSIIWSPRSEDSRYYRLKDHIMVFQTPDEWKSSLQLYYTHKYLRMKYDEIEKVFRNPWMYFEVKAPNEGWEDATGPLLFKEDYSYNLKSDPFTPTDIKIGGYNVPEPVSQLLTNGTIYFTPSFTETTLFNKYEWRNDSVDGKNLGRRLIHLTEESAIIHCRALLSFTNSDI